MNREGKPDAEAITKLGEAWKTRWDAQRRVDDRNASYLMLDNPVDAQKDGSGRPLKGFRSGIGLTLTSENAALTNVTPIWHLNVPDPNDDKAKEHADGLLEPFIAGAWGLSQQAGPVAARKSFDLHGFGRSWDLLLPHPDMWANKTIEQYVEKMNASTDPEERKHYQEAIKRERRGIWPIRLTYVSPRGTWTTFESEYALPEVIECRSMRREDVEARWGKDALPGPIRSNERSQAIVEVFIWANWEWYAVVIPDREDPKIVQEFEHRFHRSPYSLAEANIATDNPQGIRWPGHLYPVWYMIDTFDEQLSDLRENHRDNTRTPRILKLDRESYPPDQLASGRPQTLDITDGMVIWKDEDIILAPVPQINPQSLHLNEIVQNLIQTVAFRAVERADLQPNQSQNLFSTAVQVSERRFSAIVGAIGEDAKAFAQRLFAAVERLDDEVSLYPGHKGKGVITVTPKDVAGWGPAVYARVPRGIPMDQNLMAATAKQYLDMRISPETVFEQVLNIEHPAAEIKKGRDFMLEEALMSEVVIPATIARIKGETQELTPEDIKILQELFSTASPDLLEFLTQAAVQPPASPMPAEGMPPEMGGMPPPDMMPPEMGGMPPVLSGNERQAISNIARTGVPLQPQLPGELTVGP